MPPTSSPFRATKARSRRSSIGPAALAAVVTPFGGGSSVVGGVEAPVDETRFKGAITLDLRDLNRVLEIDRTSRAARIEAGIFGPGARGAAAARTV